MAIDEKTMRCTAHDLPLERQRPGTPEQAFVGERFACPTCHSSILVMSEGLKRQLATMEQSSLFA